MAKICIDAGHGGHDPGAVGSGQREKDNVLRIATMLGIKLIRSGHEVVYTRNTDVFIPLRDRAVIANAAGCGLFISVHQNSAKNVATGIEVWTHPNAARVAQNMGAEVSRQVAQVTGLRDRGLKHSTKLLVLYATNMPAMLLELGFINNAKDMLAIRNSEDEITNRIVNIVNQQYGGSLPLPEEELKVPEIRGFSVRGRYRAYAVVKEDTLNNVSEVVFRMTPQTGATKGRSEHIKAAAMESEPNKFYATVEPIVGEKNLIEIIVYDKSGKEHIQDRKTII